MKAEAIARRRLGAQHLTGAPCEGPESVVRWLGAVQSQEYALALWSLAQRAGNAARSEIERAIADGSILRTHVLRPTWHFVHRDDIRWLLELTAPHVIAAAKHRHRELGLDDDTVTRSLATMRRALRSGSHLTRRELLAALEHAGISTQNQRGPHLLMHAELTALICSGRPHGRQHTYALLDERAPGTKNLSRDEALGELALRYFRSHGPATLKDYRWWSGLRAVDAKRGVEIAGAQLDRFDAGDRTFLMNPAAPPVRASVSRVHLIQEFDEYLVAYTESRDACDVAGLLPHGKSLARAVLIDGQVAGRWRRTATGPVDVELLRAVSSAQERAIAAALKRYEAFCAS